jgi:hypothetical protein
VTAATGGVVGSGGGSNTSLNIKTEEEFKSAQSSPQISPMGNKSTKSSPVPISTTILPKPSDEKQKDEAPIPPAPPIQKPPSTLQRVLAPFRRKNSKSAIKAETEKPKSPPSFATTPIKTAAPVAQEETLSVSESISEATNTTTAPTSTYIEEDETKYNAIAEFKPGKSRKNVVQIKAQKPVPGLWQGTTNEINISCNRNLTRKVITHLAVEALLRDQVFSKAVPKRFKQPIIKKKKHTIIEKSLEVVLVGHPQPPKEKVFKTIQLKRPLLVYRVEEKFVEPSPKKQKLKTIPVSALAVLNQEILNKNRISLSCDKIFKASRPTEIIKLNCKSSKEAIKNVDINIRRKEEKRAANVTVIAVDVMDVNWAKASKKLKAIIDPLKKNLAEIIEQQAAIIEAEKERLSRTPRLEDDEISSSCSEKQHRQFETQASIVLSGLRNAEPGFFSSTSSSTLTDYSSHLPFDQDYIPGEPLILPDKSILEEYVHRKRSELERLYSEPLRSPSRGGGSPCLSTTSELVPACAVRIIEPRNRGIGNRAFISAPNRSTADSIESHSLPTSNRNSKMIELISYPPSYDSSNNNSNNNNNNNTVGWRNALRKPVGKREALTIQHFDAPKTPFEAAMQNQAAQMAKKSSVASNLSALSEGDAQDTSLAEPLPLDLNLQQQQHRRRPSIESTQSMPPIATGTVGQSFAQAAALASQPRHERYAAHIPVRQTSIEPSGRQSTTSIDSTNSGVLDTASRQLDQMIDQARYRHHQHRSKFKEAIDYLDQIFEDLKKEVEPPTSISSEHKTEIPPPQSTRGIQAAKAVFQKPAASAATTVLPQQPSIVPPSSQTNNVPIVRLRKPSELALRQQQQQNQNQHQQHGVPSILHQPQPIRNGFNSGAGISGAPKIGYSTPLRHPTTTTILQSQPSTSTNIPASTAPLSSSATAVSNGSNGIGGPGPKPFPKIESSGDVEISETIVLPTKGNPEKMNFTRQWLAGDIKSWAEKPDLIVPSGGDLTSPNDSDDRSIGSCSAEVAAINAQDRKKKRQIRETPDIIKSSKTDNNNIVSTTATKSKQSLQQHPITIPQPQQPMAMPAPQPLRPQPLRPQPQYASFPINGQMPTTEQPSLIGLQKAPSNEYVMAIQRAHQERAGSQDYQSLGSVHSQDGYKPLSTLSLYSNSLNRSGAFQQYPQRGSIHSLPDASLTTSSLISSSRPPYLSSSRQTNYGIQQDPILAMDALVAELELNTDLDRNGEKRRSFPTGFGGNTSMNRNNFRPLASTTVTQTTTTTGNGTGGLPRHGSFNIKPQNSNNGGSMDRGLRRMQIQQRSSLDEMANMLTNVAGDLKPSATKPISNGHSYHPQPQSQHQNAMAQPLKKFGLKSVAPETNKIGFSPFETINQERFAPSRVGAMQQMFETKKQTSNGIQKFLLKNIGNISH